MNIEIEKTNVPDREFPVVEIWYGPQMLAEINREGGSVSIEIYGLKGNRPACIPLDELIVKLDEARSLLE